MSVAFDSGALIVALQEACKLNAPESIARHDKQRSLLLPYLDTLHPPFIVPVIAFSEFLFGIPEQYKYLAMSLGEDFKISDLTQRVALIASRIRMQLLDGKAQEEACNNYGQDKKSFLADIYILAICKADGVTELITRDRPLWNKAKRLGIPCIHIDDIPEPVLPIAAPQVQKHIKPPEIDIFALPPVADAEEEEPKALAAKEPAVDSTSDPSSSPPHPRESRAPDSVAAAEESKPIEVAPTEEIPEAAKPNRRRTIRKLKDDSATQS